MALHATQVSGGTAAEWVYNDFLQLLTGVMTDQQTTLNYRPGTTTAGTGTLRLKGDGKNPLLVGFDTNSSTVTFTLDHSGNLTAGIGTSLPTTRNGVATPAEVYTGTTTPVGDGVTTPRTGAMWIKG